MDTNDLNLDRNRVTPEGRWTEPPKPLTIEAGRWLPCRHGRPTWLRLHGEPVCGECLGYRLCAETE